MILSKKFRDFKIFNIVGVSFFFSTFRDECLSIRKVYIDSSYNAFQ